MRKLWRFLVTVVVVLGVLMGIARAIALRAWRVPDNDPYLEASISPTLRGGDLILLWRWSPPHTGDLVLCPEPKRPDRVVIGRIAAVEEETIEVNGATVTLNGHRVQVDDACYEGKFTSRDPETHIPVEQRCEIEELGTRLHQRGDVTDTPPEKVTLGPLERGQIFLLSDNRQYPYDSREFGPVDRTTCKETVVFRLVSAAGFGDVASRLTFLH
jgi:signal peptidase I